MADGGSVTIRAILDSSGIKRGVRDAKSQLNSIDGKGLDNVSASADKASKKLGVLSGAAKVAKSGLKLLSSTAVAFGKVGVGAVAGVASSIAGITAAIGGIAITGGIGRAMAIGEAQAKMTQLGMDVDSTMTSVNASVSGTKYALNEAASSAVSLGSAGVAAGDDMTAALKSVASTASISGREFSDVGAIYAKVAASGKLSTDVMNQLLESGVSVTAALSAKLGVTQDQVSQMVTSGQIDFKTFSDAMYEYLGDASVSANSTFSGAMANVRAALSRVGAAFASPALEGLRQIFVALIPAVNAANTCMQPLVQTFSDFVNGGVGRVVPLITAFTDAIKSGASPVQAFQGLIVGLSGVIADLATQAIVGLANGLSVVVQALAQMLPEIMPTIVDGITSLVTQLGPVVVSLLPVLLDSALQLFMGFVTAFDQVLPVIIGVLPELISKLVEFLAANGPSILNSAFTMFIELVNGLNQVLPLIIEAIPGFVAMIGQALIENLPSLLVALAELAVLLLTALGTLLNSIIDCIVGWVFNTLVPAIQEWWTSVGEACDMFWQSIQQALEQWFANLIQAFVNWGSGVISFWTGLWNDVCNTASSIWNSIVSVISGAISSAYNAVCNIVNSIRNTVSSVFESVRGTVSDVWNGIKDSITEKIQGACDTVGRIIDTIKGFFNFQISWPHIPLPHPYISPSGWKIGDLLHGSTPSIGIDWYAKGGIFDKASVIGIGEAGTEAAIPLEGRRMRPFANAIAGEMGKGGNGGGSGDVNIFIEHFEHSGSEEDDEELLRRIALKVKMRKRAGGFC